MTTIDKPAEVIELIHGRSRLALHHLRAGDGNGQPLLLLHGLGEQTPAAPPGHVAAWPGPVYGLDLTGHGRSTHPVGGGYSAEVLMADVDAALAHLGTATILGRGLGAYIGLLIAGGRPAEVRGVILADGPGLAGGGERPASPTILTPEPTHAGGPDPYALAELSRDVRPADYAVEYVRQIMEFSRVERPITVSAVVRPEWLAAVVAEPGVIQRNVVDALAVYIGSDGGAGSNTSRRDAGSS